jgi:16S rRNA C967 or C1407 C5-methylase (RsmB/RsmF family)
MSLPKDIQRAKDKVRIFQEIEESIFQDIKQKYKLDEIEEEWLVDYLFNNFGEKTFEKIIEEKLKK